MTVTAPAPAGAPVGIASAASMSCADALVIFVIRTRRVPFFRSRASLPMTLAALSVVAVGAVLPFTPIAHTLGFDPLPGAFFAALVGMVIAYLLLIEVGKRYFYRVARVPSPPNGAPTAAGRHLIRRARRFITAH